MRLIKGDCLEEMDKLIEEGIVVDAIITDPPYGTTACKWDSVIPFDRHILIQNGKKEVIMYKKDYITHKLYTSNHSYGYIRDSFNELARDGMWQKLNKLIKPNGAIVLFGSEPFSSALRMSNIKNYKYDWIWDKKQSGNPFLAKRQPLKTFELVSIFNKHNYYPVMTKGKMRKKGGGSKSKIFGNTDSVVNDLYYPKAILDINNCSNKSRNQHPTQKPVELMEYLIKTYTNEKELVLDFTMGSGTTGLACKNLNRRFIGIEKDEGYFNIAKNRIENIHNL